MSKVDLSFSSFELNFFPQSFSLTDASLVICTGTDQTYSKHKQC